MKKIALIVCSFISLGALTACSGSSSELPVADESNVEKQAQRVTIVSSGRPADVLPAFSSFSWNEQYNMVLSAVNKGSEKDLKEYIRAQLVIYLQSKGYQYQPDPMQADVVIGFLFALEDDIADRAIQDKFGLLPGLHKSSATAARYEKGTLLLSVLDAQLKEVYWRSAMQGFVDLEKERNNPNTERMQTVLQLMMGGFPKAGR